jgi:micrococcal nuclease
MTGRVVWVADGDIGVNAPEIPHHQARGWREGGAQAHAANRQLVTRRAAALELDIARRDSYGRLLAYVWVQGVHTRVMANAEMIRQGFAQVMTVLPNVRYQGLFLALQREARQAGRGLWGGA